MHGAIYSASNQASTSPLLVTDEGSISFVIQLPRKNAAEKWGSWLPIKLLSNASSPTRRPSQGLWNRRAWGGRGIDTLPDFEIYVNPITARGVADYAHHNTICSPPPDFQTFRRLWPSSSILAQALELRLMMRIRGLIEITSNHYKLTQSCKTSKQTPILQASRTWSWREEKKIDQLNRS